MKNTSFWNSNDTPDITPCQTNAIVVPVDDFNKRILSAISVFEEPVPEVAILKATRMRKQHFVREG